ncbi:MAG: uncharacterized protein JWN95_3433 [Frankiales bacterium]|nr:uncharacterized protein [Frankiales bacterium]
MSATSARRPLPALVFLLVLTVLTAVVWWRVLHRPQESSATGQTTGPTPVVKCTPGVKSITLPAPKAVSVAVYNGSQRDHLAATVQTELRARGFTVPSVADAPSVLAGAGQIQYGPAGRPAASLLTYYLPGLKPVLTNTAAKSVKVILGKGFENLAAQTAVTKALAQVKAC